MSSTSMTNTLGNTNTREDKYVLWLFVAGDEPNSALARAKLTQICETYLPDRCEISVFDVFEDFRPALEHEVFVTPTLLLRSPLPQVIIHGNLSDTAKVLTALRISEET